MARSNETTAVRPKYFQLHFLSIVFCFWFSMFIYVQTFGIYLNFLDFGYYTTGIIMGSYGIMQVIIRFPMGIIADKCKISGKLLVSIGFASSFTSALLLALTTELIPIFFGRFLAGVTAAMWVVLTIWYSASFCKNKSLKAMSQLQTTTVGSQLIAMVFSSWIVDLYGFTILFWIGAVFAALGFMLVLLLPNNDRLAHEKIKGKLTTDRPVVTLVIKERKLWSLSVLSLLAHAVLFSTIFGFSSVYFHRLNENPSSIMFLVIAFMLPHTVAPMLLAMKKASLVNPFKMLVICFGIGTVSLLLLGYVNNWIIYCFLHAVLGLSLGFVFPILLDQVYKSNRIGGPKTIMGFYQSVYSIGIIAGPFTAGYFAREIEIGAVFVLSAVFLVFGAIISVMENMKLQKEW